MDDDASTDDAPGWRQGLESADVPRPPPAADGDRQDLADEDAARELDRLRQRLSLVGAAAKVGIWEYDFERDDLWVSDELANLYGVPPGELTWPEFVSRLHPDDVVVPLERPTPSYPFGQVNEFFFRVRHADGTYRSIRSRSTTHGHDGVPVRKVGAHIDMTDDPLFRLAELSKAHEQLRRFACMASHDLRSPLRAVRHLIRFVIEDHHDVLPEEATSMLTEAEDRAARLDRLVVDMLDYATSDVQDAKAAPTSIRRLLRDVLETVDRRQCRIVVDCEIDDRPHLVAEPLAACLRNLVDNACKHHDKPNGTVTVSVTFDGPWLRVDVADDGPGIPPGFQKQIFEPFRTTDPGRGSGLGLAYVRTTIEQHDGSLDLVSDAGAGTMFTLRWPVRTGTDPSGER